MHRHPIEPPSRPCASCPWSRTTPPGQFSLERYEALRATVGSPGHEIKPGEPLFSCHKAAEGKERPCAGWLVAVGWHHLTVRLWVTLGRLRPDALRAKPGWPELFYDYDELVAVQAAPAGRACQLDGEPHERHEPIDEPDETEEHAT